MSLRDRRWWVRQNPRFFRPSGGSDGNDEPESYSHDRGAAGSRLAVVEFPPLGRPRTLPDQLGRGNDVAHRAGRRW